MNLEKFQYITLFFAISIVCFTTFQNGIYAEYETIKITTSEIDYTYGDYLSYQITESEITDNLAVVYLIIENKGVNTPLLTDIIISSDVTEITAPFPFDKGTWDYGKYTLEVRYGDEVARTDFNIIDTGQIAIPYWIKDLAKMWITEEFVTDKDFARAIEYLIQKKIIIVPLYDITPEEKQVNIPNWVKQNAAWWIDGKISDTEFALSLQYLIKIRIISI